MGLKSECTYLPRVPSHEEHTHTSSLPDADSEKGQGGQLHPGGFNKHVSMGSVTQQELQQPQLQGIFQGTLINGKHSFLSSGSGSTPSLCDRLRDAPLGARRVPRGAVVTAHQPDVPPSPELCASIAGGPEKLGTLPASIRATGQQKRETCVFPLSYPPQTRCPRHFLHSASSPLHAYARFGNRHLAKNRF